VEAEFPIVRGHGGQMLAVVGVYPLRTDAYDRSLVVASMEVPHWVLRQDALFALCVTPGDAPRVAEELARFETERARTATIPIACPGPGVRFSPISLYGCVWVMSGFYTLQAKGPAWWMERGTASSHAIMRGAWWEAFTALTLHADLSHLGANLAAGLVYAGFLLPILGSGWTWLFILLAGGLGNLLNAFRYRAEAHFSIGASTAVFGALGILVAAQCTARALQLREVRLREFLLPIGAGLGLLAYLGVGEIHDGTPDPQIDYMAHLFGLIAGAPFGIAAVWLRLGKRTPGWLQALLALSAPALLALCWKRAAG
jgi:membrane associated rhomboid family serine protease